MYFVAKPKHPPVSSAPISNGCIKQKILKLEIKLEIKRFKNKLDINEHRISKTEISKIIN